MTESAITLPRTTDVLNFFLVKLKLLPIKKENLSVYSLLVAPGNAFLFPVSRNFPILVLHWNEIRFYLSFPFWLISLNTQYLRALSTL